MSDHETTSPSDLTWAELTNAYLGACHNSVTHRQTMDAEVGHVARAASARRLAELVTAADDFGLEILRRIVAQTAPGVPKIDVESSASRQHYIDTGYYLPVDEADEPEPVHPGVTPRIEGKMFLDTGESVDFLLLPDGALSRWGAPLDVIARTVDATAAMRQAAAPFLAPQPTEEPDDDENECEGHYDTDDALVSGVGIGEATYCDGTCRSGS